MSGRSYFTIGVVLVLLGIQLRAVETFVLNQKASDFLETRMRQSAIVQETSFNNLLLSSGPTPRKQLTHPRWMGLALISAGAVMMLHGMARKVTKPS